MGGYFETMWGDLFEKSCEVTGDHLRSCSEILSETYGVLKASLGNVGESLRKVFEICSECLGNPVGNLCGICRKVLDIL